MAEGILGLGSGQAATLNQDLIDKLKAAERKSRVEPLETSIENITGETGESAKLNEIKTKVTELLDTVKPLDLFVTSGVNAFEQKSASATGTAALFDATDIGKLNLGTTTVNVTALAQRDVSQTGKFFDKSTTILGSDSSDDTLVVTHNGTDYTFETNGKTYEQLAESINLNSKLVASVETIGTNEFRLVIKSKEPGLDNALTITENGSLDLGFDNKIYNASNSYPSMTIPSSGNLTLDGEIFSLDGSENYADLVTKINQSANFNAAYVNDKLVVSRIDGNDIVVDNDDFNLGLSEDTSGGKILNAANMEATVDGVAYNVSSNSITIEGGLKITAAEIGTASVNVQEDTSSITTTMNNLVTKYNELVKLVDDEILYASSKIEDKSSLRTMMNGIKEKIFGSYGTNNSLNIFNFGFEVDKSGVLSLNTTTFNEALQNNTDDLKSLFVGVAEDRGLGTQLKEYVDSLDSFDGLLTTYENNMNTRKTNLEKEKDDAIEDLDSKYALLSQQFAAYGAIINQFEAQFSGLKLMIQQSTAR